MMENPLFSSDNRKDRLDVFLQERYPHLTRNQIQSFIMQGMVKVDGNIITKAGKIVSEKSFFELDLTIPKYVCRAGFKLEKALDHFKIKVTDFVVMDAGLSTGGFTDCLLQKGAAKVYGIDVGHNQVHEKIRQDARVHVMEQTNLRYVTSLPELVDLVTLDLAFISVLKVMHVVKAVLKPAGLLIVLIKPQFEAARSQVGKGGVIKDELIHTQVVAQVTQGIMLNGFLLIEVIDSPLLGSAGNKEFLAYFKKNN